MFSILHTNVSTKWSEKYITCWLHCLLTYLFHTAWPQQHTWHPLDKIAPPKAITHVGCIQSASRGGDGCWWFYERAYCLSAICARGNKILVPQSQEKGVWLYKPGLPRLQNILITTLLVPTSPALVLDHPETWITNLFQHFFVLELGVHIAKLKCASCDVFRFHRKVVLQLKVHSCDVVN